MNLIWVIYGFVVTVKVVIENELCGHYVNKLKQKKFCDELTNVEFNRRLQMKKMQKSTIIEHLWRLSFLKQTFLLIEKVLRSF